MTIVERLKNRLEEIREENRTPIMRQRSFDAQANSLFFEAGYEAAIKELERALSQANVIGSAAVLPPPDEVKSEIRRLWNLPSDPSNSPKARAVKLFQKFNSEHGVEVGLKAAKDYVEQHCL